MASAKPSLFRRLRKLLTRLRDDQRRALAAIRSLQAELRRTEEKEAELRSLLARLGGFELRFEDHRCPPLIEFCVRVPRERDKYFEERLEWVRESLCRKLRELQTPPPLPSRVEPPWKPFIP